MSKYFRKLFSLVILLGFVVLVIYYNPATGNLFGLRRGQKIPKAYVTATEDFVINQVGKTEFEQNYELDYENSDDCTNEKVSCTVAYKFKPAQKFLGSSYYLFYDIAGSFVTFYNTQPLPSCKHDANNCDFKLTRDALESIAEQEQLESYYTQMLMYKSEIVIELSQCDLDTGRNIKRVFVDTQSGDIVFRAFDEECFAIRR